MFPDFAQLAAFVAIAILSGVIWHASSTRYCWAVVAAAITGGLAAYVALGMALGRAPHGLFLTMSMPLCGLFAAAIGIPFHRLLSGSVPRLLGACAGIFVLSIVVVSALIMFSKTWGKFLEINSRVATFDIVFIGVLLALLLGGILSDQLVSTPQELRTRDKNVTLAIEGLPTSPTEAAAALDGMPDTVIVHSKMMDFGAAFYVASAGVLALWWVTRTGNASTWVWLAALIVFALCEYFAVRIWKSKPGQLIVTCDGFRPNGASSRKIRWGEIDGYFWKDDDANESFVAYRLIQRDVAMHRSPLRSFDGSVREGSTVLSTQLAQLLNRRLHLWRTAHVVDCAQKHDT